MDNKLITVTSPLLPNLDEFHAMLQQIWDSKWVTNMGQFHKELEKALAEYLHVPYVCLFTNGTLPLMTALQALRITGEVITTPYSFVATTHSIWWNGCKPVFVDIDPATGNMDPDKIEAAITPQTTAIMPVHCYGKPCDTKRIQEIADKYGYEPIRYFMLTAGYRMPLNYTVDLIESCKNSLDRLYTCRDNLDFAISHAHGTDTALAGKCDQAREKFRTAMDDDLNTPDALAAIFDFVKEINTLSDASDKAVLEQVAATFDELTGVLGLMYNRRQEQAPAEVLALVEERTAAKKAKDWARADAIRARLTELGWSVADTAKGPQLSKL